MPEMILKVQRPLAASNDMIPFYLVYNQDRSITLQIPLSNKDVAALFERGVIIVYIDVIVTNMPDKVCLEIIGIAKNQSPDW